MDLTRLTHTLHTYTLYTLTHLHIKRSRALAGVCALSARYARARVKWGKKSN